jgi:hypothetical protein
VVKLPFAVDCCPCSRSACGGAGFSYRQLNINATAVRSVLTNAWAAGDRGVLCLATDYLGPTARRRWSQLDLQVSGGV